MRISRFLLRYFSTMRSSAWRSMFSSCSSWSPYKLPKPANKTMVLSRSENIQTRKHYSRMRNARFCDSPAKGSIPSEQIDRRMWKHYHSTTSLLNCPRSHNFGLNQPNTSLHIVIKALYTYLGWNFRASLLWVLKFQFCYQQSRFHIFYVFLWRFSNKASCCFQTF